MFEQFPEEDNPDKDLSRSERHFRLEIEKEGIDIINELLSENADALARKQNLDIRVVQASLESKNKN